jgi:hypothetical protein
VWTLVKGTVGRKQLDFAMGWDGKKNCFLKNVVISCKECFYFLNVSLKRKSRCIFMEKIAIF